MRKETIEGNMQRRNGKKGEEAWELMQEKVKCSSARKRGKRHRKGESELERGCM